MENGNPEKIEGMPLLWLGRPPLLLNPSYVRALHMVVCLDDPRNNSELYIPASRIRALIEDHEKQLADGSCLEFLDKLTAII